VSIAKGAEVEKVEVNVWVQRLLTSGNLKMGGKKKQTEKIPKTTVVIEALKPKR